MNDDELFGMHLILDAERSPIKHSEIEMTDTEKYVFKLKSHSPAPFRNNYDYNMKEFNDVSWIIIRFKEVNEVKAAIINRCSGTTYDQRDESHSNILDQTQALMKADDINYVDVDICKILAYDEYEYEKLLSFIETAEIDNWKNYIKKYRMEILKLDD